MNLAQMKIFARSLIRDKALIDAHFIRWVNVAYKTIARSLVIPRLNAGDPVVLVAVSGSTQKFYLPYDFQKTIAFFDSTGRSLDIMLSEDVRQFGEYNSFGSFVQFYEFTSANITPLYDSIAQGTTLSITNKSTTATASSAIFTSAHVGEWLLPLDVNTTAGASNPEDFGYLIASTTGTVAVPSATCVLARPFRGTLSDGGTVGDLATARFEIRPRNVPICRIWGDPGSSSPSAVINIEYQRNPSKLANDEDTPEEDRLSEAIVYSAINLAGWAYQNAFQVQNAAKAISESTASFVHSKDFDRLLIRNFMTSNPMIRQYSQGVVGRHMGMHDVFSTSSIRY